MLELLREREFPAREIVPFASERSAGRELEGGLVVRGPDDEAIQGFDLALFSAGGSTSGEWAPTFADAGAIVIDNSSRWRMQDDVPLVVSEVNPDALAAPSRDRRQPQLLDDADGRRAQADPRRGRIERLVISPTRPSPAPASAPSTSCSTSRTRCCTSARSQPPERLRAPDRLQRAAPRRHRSPPARITPTRSAS